MARTTYRATWAAPNHGGALTPSRMAHMVTVTGNSLVLFALQLVDQVTGSVISARVDAELDGDIAICDAIRMEVLAGARDESHLEALRGLLARASVLPTEPAHYDEAARLYRRCRREGETVRRLIDCLIAAVAIGAGVPVLHRDDDFDVLARHTELDIVR